MVTVIVFDQVPLARQLIVLGILYESLVHPIMMIDFALEPSARKANRRSKRSARRACFVSARS
jgi:hypothetical protein